MKNCVGCGISVYRAPLYRVNEKGKQGVFKCEGCLPSGMTIDPKTRKIVEAIHNG